MIRDVVRLVAVAAALSLGLAAYGTFRIWQQGERDERRPADAIVVLGAAQYDGRPSPVLAARLDHALELFRTGDYHYFVVTGGRAIGDRTTEAAVARGYALAHGVPDVLILVEDRGRTTLESLESVVVLLRAHDARTAVLVSDRTHMLRVLRMAGDLGIQGWGSPTATGPIDADPVRRAGAYVHELGALAYYLVLGGSPAEELAEPRR